MNFNMSPGAMEGLAGIDHQVHYNLLNLSCIPPHCRYVVVNNDFEADVVIDQATQQHFRFADDDAQVQATHLDHLLAAECERLRGECCCPF